MKELPPIPDFLAHRPVDHRGYPYLFMLGEEQFKGIVTDRLVQCITDRLCGICGKKLGYWITFVGGPKSVENRVFGDPPFHRECAEFAFDICPYLLTGGWDRTNLKHMQKSLVDDPSGDAKRPDRMALYTTRQYKWDQLPSGVVLFLPAPAKQIEWRDIAHGNHLSATA